MSKDTKQKEASGPSPTYKIYIKAVSGTNLVVTDHDGASDPYLVFRLEGTQDAVQTKYIANNINPIWNEEVVLDGYFVGSDLLRIQVFDKDRKKKADDHMGFALLPIREIRPGVTVNKQITLVKTDKKGKIEKNAEEGSAGYLTLQFSLQRPGNPAWVESPWAVTIYDASIQIVSATGLPAREDDKPNDPYVKIRLTASPNAQKRKTRSQKDTLNPEWSETKKFFMGDYETDGISFTVLCKDPTDEDFKLSSAVVPFTDFPAERGYTEKDIPLTPAGKFTEGGVLKVRVQISKPAVDVRPSADGADKASSSDSDECDFTWGSYTSSYSTNFTGYDTCSEPLSPIHSDDKEVHYHPPPPLIERHVHPPQTLKGTLISSHSLPQIGSDQARTDFYITVDLVGKTNSKGKLQKTPVTSDLSDSVFNLDFDFGQVRKGWAVEFVVWQTSSPEDSQIGYASVEVKKIELDHADPIEVPLQEPPLFKFTPSDVSNWGSLSVRLELKLAE